MPGVQENFLGYAAFMKIIFISSAFSLEIINSCSNNPKLDKMLSSLW